MSEHILAIEELEVSFSGFKALNGVNLQIERGELRVLLGANGAGKSTLLDIICGKTKSTAGKVIFKGKDMTNASEVEIARAGLGRKFQTPTVFKTLTVQQNLEVAQHLSFSVWKNLFKRVPAEITPEIRSILVKLELLELASALAGELSHGQTQWLELGMILIQNPSLLLLDEPTAGMTASETDKTSRILNNLKGSHTIIVVEHDMAFVRQICEKITVMHQGKVLAEGNATEIQNNQKVIEAYLGSAEVSHV
jgi:urea transport system ATP-binding protein